MRGVSKEHAGISYPVVGLFFMNWYTAHSAVNSDKGALNCRHEYHVRFKMCCKSWELLSCGFDLLFLNRQISVLSQSWLLLYLLLHFVPSKKTLFISVFKVFFLSFNFYRKSCDFPWRTWVGTLFPAVRFRPGVSFPDEDRCVQRCFKAGLTMTGVRQRPTFVGFHLLFFTYFVDNLMYNLW